jgi:PAS domain S-box-containing protein
MTGKRNPPTRLAALQEENQELRRRLDEAEDTLRAIREGEVDAVVVTGSRGAQIFSLSGVESMYRLIVETMQEATLTLAPEGAILWCNQQFASLLRSSVSQILGKPLQLFVNPDQHPRLDALLEQFRDASVRERVVFRAADGTPIQTSVGANRLLQPEGTIICLVVSNLAELASPTDMARRLQE